MMTSEAQLGIYWWTMTKTLRNKLLICLGWMFVVIGAIGAVLPILPTTPFMLLALALFSKSSPRFHQMLLHNRWFGPALQQWETKKTVTQNTKIRAILLVITTFTISIFLVSHTIELQIMLLLTGIVLLFFMSRLKVSENRNRR